MEAIKYSIYLSLVESGQQTEVEEPAVAMTNWGESFTSGNRNICFNIQKSQFNPHYQHFAQGSGIRQAERT